MPPRLTFRQYRAIDLALFSLILCAAETLLARAASVWFPGQLYTVSAVGALTAIVMMRWGAPSAVYAALGGLALCLNSGASPTQYGIYIGGNLFALLALPLVRAVGSERVRRDSFLSVSFGLCVLLLMQAGRAVVAFVLGTSARNCLGFFTTDSLSLLFTGLLVWTARRMDGLFEDQKHYLLRIQERDGDA